MNWFIKKQKKTKKKHYDGLNRLTPVKLAYDNTDLNKINWI